jgi:hypothetical protein
MIQPNYDCSDPLTDTWLLRTPEMVANSKSVLSSRIGNESNLSQTAAKLQAVSPRLRNKENPSPFNHKKATI